VVAVDWKQALDAHREEMQLRRSQPSEPESVVPGYPGPKDAGTKKLACLGIEPRAGSVGLHSQEQDGGFG